MRKESTLDNQKHNLYKSDSTLGTSSFILKTNYIILMLDILNPINFI